LSFCPNQTDFESAGVARNFAALLGLFKFMKTMPLENKLPHPYNVTWRAMLDADKEEEKEKKVCVYSVYLYVYVYLSISLFFSYMLRTDTSTCVCLCSNCLIKLNHTYI